MSVFYVHIACYVTKEHPENGFSATSVIPVRVEATTPEEAKQKVGELLSEALEATEAFKEIAKAMNLQGVNLQGVAEVARIQEGESDVR